MTSSQYNSYIKINMTHAHCLPGIVERALRALWFLSQLVNWNYFSQPLITIWNRHCCYPHFGEEELRLRLKTAQCHQQMGKSRFEQGQFNPWDKYFNHIMQFKDNTYQFSYICFDHSLICMPAAIHLLMISWSSGLNVVLVSSKWNGMPVDYYRHWGVHFF